MQSYPAKYSDEYGEELTTIHNDGKTLRITVRGVDFAGRDFDGLEPADNSTKQKLQTFSLGKFRELCECKIKCEIPIKIQAQKEIPAKLIMNLGLGKETVRGGPDEEDLILTLQYDGKEFRSNGTSGWFEDELVGLQKQLPVGHHLKCCFGCAFSDYWPAGHGLFGSMHCFRNSKVEYLAVTTKADFWKIADSVAEIVQETYLCAEFEIRKPNTGYRG